MQLPPAKSNCRMRPSGALTTKRSFTRSSPPIRRPAAPEPRRRSPAPKCAAAAKSRGARKARARRAPDRFAAPFGWAAAGPSQRGRGISRKRSTARCIAPPCNPWCRSWCAKIACSRSNHWSSRRRKRNCSSAKLAEFGLTRALDPGRGLRGEVVPRGPQRALCRCDAGGLARSLELDQARQGDRHGRRLEVARTASRRRE